MPQVIFETDDWSTMIFLFTNIDEPNHNGKAMTRAALREFIARQPVDSCVEPINVHWNKSDTHTYCVVACSRERVGVDIEYMRERPFEKISRRYFDPTEVTDDMEIFFDIWCQKEAYTKWKKGKIAKYMSQKIDKDVSQLVPQSRYSLIELDGLPYNIRGYLCY